MDLWYSLHMTTTPINPKNVRLALITAGIDTNMLTIVPSSHGVLITALTDSPANVVLINTVHATLLTIAGMSDVTRRSPTALKIHNPRRRR